MGLVESTKKTMNKLNQTNGQFAVHETQRLKRIKKACLGCGDNFTCFKQANYVYCQNCAINGTRYWQNLCAECGNGSGVIKFPHQPPRPCKLCYLQPRIEQKELKHA